MLTKLTDMQANAFIRLCFAIGGVQQKGGARLDEMGLITHAGLVNKVQRRSRIHQPRCHPNRLRSSAAVGN